MSQLLDQLQPQMRAFFEAFFVGSSQVKSLEELAQKAGSDSLEITIGRHKPYCGPTVDIHGHLFLPRGAIHVERDMVYFTGKDRKITFYQAAAPEAAKPAEPAPPPTPPTGKPLPELPPAAHQYTMVRIVERVDPLDDDLPTMKRLFAGLAAATPAEPGSSGSSAAPATGKPAAWAEAILAQRTADPTVLMAPLETLTSPPAGMPVQDLTEYKNVMYALCTYSRDGKGTHYSKRLPLVTMPSDFPEGTTDEYRLLNAREVVCEAGATYCLCNLPEGWFHGVDRQPGLFREILFKMGSAEGGGTELIPVSWGTRVIGWADAHARDFFDFCFFVADALPEFKSDEPDEPFPE